MSAAAVPAASPIERHSSCISRPYVFIGLPWSRRSGSVLSGAVSADSNPAMPALPLGTLVVSDSGSETGAASRVHVWADAVRCGQLDRAQCSDQHIRSSSGTLFECLRGSGRRGHATPTLVGMTIEVVLESEVTDLERAAVAEVFETAGIQADVQSAYVRRSADLLPWIIEIIVTGVGARFMWAAAAGAGDEAGRDAWKGLKKLITGLYE